MMPRLSENLGDRPSRLALGRYHTNELTEEERETVEAWLAANPEDTYLQDLEASRNRVREFDPKSLRARAASSMAAPAPLPRPANQAWRWALPLLAVAAALLMMLRPPSEPTDPAGIAFRGTASLEVFQLSGQVLVPYEGEALGEGDTIGFRVVPGDHDHLVLLSVEVDGTVNVLYPETGESEPITPGGRAIELPGSIILDDAPDPEVFVAVFGTGSTEAAAEAREAYQGGGLEAVLDWADDPDVDAVEVVRQ